MKLNPILEKKFFKIQQNLHIKDKQYKDKFKEKEKNELNYALVFEIN